MEKIESAAQTDPDLKAAIEALANDVAAAAKASPELAAAIQALTETVQAQRSTPQNPAKIAETIGINTQNIHGGQVYQSFGQGDINI